MSLDAPLSSNLLNESESFGEEVIQKDLTLNG